MALLQTYQVTNCFVHITQTLCYTNTTSNLSSYLHNNLCDFVPPSMASINYTWAPYLRHSCLC